MATMRTTTTNRSILSCLPRGVTEVPVPQRARAMKGTKIGLIIPQSRGDDVRSATGAGTGCAELRNRRDFHVQLAAQRRRRRHRQVSASHSVDAELVHYFQRRKLTIRRHLDRQHSKAPRLQTSREDTGPSELAFGFCAHKNARRKERPSRSQIT